MKRLAKYLCACAVGGITLTSTSAQIPLLHYTFDEASSGSQNAINFGSAANADATFVGATARTGNTPGGMSTGALDLTSSDPGLRYVTAGQLSALDNLSAFTLSIWVNLQATPTGNLRLMANQAGGDFDGFSWNIADPSSGSRSAANFSTRLFIGGSDGFSFDGPNTYSIGADNEWTFLAVSYDSATGSVNYYGSSANPGDPVALLGTTTIGAGTVNNSAAFNIGHTDAASSSNTAPPGFLDDARVYGIALSLAELQDVRDANVIPEPSTYAAIFGGLALLGAFVYRRRQSARR